MAHPNPSAACSVVLLLRGPYLFITSGASHPFQSTFHGAVTAPPYWGIGKLCKNEMQGISNTKRVTQKSPL